MSKNGRDGMPSLLHGQWALGGSVRKKDDGEGPLFRKRQQERVHFPECAAELASHCQDQHGTGRDPQRLKTPQPLDPRIYIVSFPRAAGPIGFPVEGCKGQAMMCTNLRIHFLHLHVQDTILILEEGNRPHPCYPDCNMFMPWATLNLRHLTTALCERGVDQKMWRLAEEESQMGAAMAFQAYGRPLDTFLSFKYLGRLLTETDNDWAPVIENLQKARKIWDRLSRILGREGADTWVLGSFYLAIVQAVLLFSTENWVMTPHIG